jgi:hypothetical protein
LAVALIALAVVVITESTISAANCKKACSTTDTKLCQGSSAGQCLACTTLNTTCQIAYGSVTSWSGLKTYGSTMGSSQVHSNNLPCKLQEPCNTQMVAGTCNAGLFGLSCTGLGMCTQCMLGNQQVVTTVPSCVDDGCKEGG